MSWEQFFGPNAGYMLELYERFQADPTTVDADTRAFFERWEPPLEATPGATAAPAAAPAVDVTRTVGTARLIRYIRELGHLAARIDPLGGDPPGDLGLELATHGVTPEDLAALPAHIVRGPLSVDAANAREGIERLRRVYSGPIGYETDHIQDYHERTWIRAAAEDRRFFQGFDVERKKEILDRLTEVETFERFLHRTFPSQKRFSLEGTDMLIPMLDAIIRNAAAAGTKEVVLGMAHRGRLNVLAHILGKAYSQILTEFMSPNFTKETFRGWTGDVKYHLGARRAYRQSGISEMPITLAPNPSHLEFVNAVIEGRARAAQERRDRPGFPLEDEKESLAVLMHGDAAFPGQGIVAETLNLSRLNGYRTGGTIHIIINNQIGFTTDVNDSRSTLYASDLAKGFEIPILHVNADDPESCIAAARMAWAYREKFQKDFLIDLVGYRRWGHNEGDEPEFTQPLMYEKIKNHPTVRELWARELERLGHITREEAAARVTAINSVLQKDYEGVRDRKAQSSDVVPQEEPEPIFEQPVITVQPLSARQLTELNEALLERPEGFTAHPKLDKGLQRRRETLSQPAGIEWAHAEQLAFAAILAEGTPIRLSGQDSERGTFSHRHLVLHDVATGEQYLPLHHIPQARASFAVYNSPLSENAVLGFEYGYSTHSAGTLVLWEAQFGDFANGAQVIIDQFIISGRAKWGEKPSLVLLLPHGYEGAGPEHSSARLERFLQLAADNNIRVANCTTAAQYFHLLRYQAASLRVDPRPLIVLTPKSLLRQPRAASTLSDLANKAFQPVLPPGAESAPASEATRLILCSGKVAVDLLGSTDFAQAEGVALARLEMLYPFPYAELQALLKTMGNLREVVWLQEEPQNQGAWAFVAPHLRSVLDPAIALNYIGRPASSSTAEGNASAHGSEQARILREAVAGVVEVVAK
jgi:2-oxoglutarate dehydrogenase E1 component